MRPGPFNKLVISPATGTLCQLNLAKLFAKHKLHPLMTPWSADPLRTSPLSSREVLPVGAGLYTRYYHPEEGPRSPLTEWTLYEGLTRHSAARTRMADGLCCGMHGLKVNMMFILTYPWLLYQCLNMDVQPNIVSSIEEWLAKDFLSAYNGFNGQSWLLLAG